MSVTKLPTAGTVHVLSPLLSDEGTDPFLSLQQATNAAVGVVKPDGTTTTVDASGIIRAAVFPLTVVQEASHGFADSSASFAVAFPQAATAGNTLFMIVACDGGAIYTAPAGWTIDIQQTQTLYSQVLVMHKAAAGGETSATISSAPVSNGSLYFFELLGAHAIDAHTAGGVAIATSLSFPAITPAAGAAVFAFACLVPNTAAVVLMPCFAPAWRDLHVLSQATASGRTLAGFVATRPAAALPMLPPQLNLEQTPLFAGSGLAYVTFSIL